VAMAMQEVLPAIELHKHISQPKLSNKNMKKILILLVAMTTFVVSCQKDFGDLNDDTKRPVAVPPGTLFSFAQKSLVDLMTSTNVNNNVFPDVCPALDGDHVHR
jgi:hypothetical protein